MTSAPMQASWSAYDRAALAFSAAAIADVVLPVMLVAMCAHALTPRRRARRGAAASVGARKRLA